VTKAGDTGAPLVELLGRLGFSPYDAKAYIGLVESAPLTGYALAKLTGVPQPKVYETLRRLEARGAALKLAGEPARYVAVDPRRLLAALEDQYTTAVDEARTGLEQLTGAGAGDWLAVQTYGDPASAMRTAQTLIGTAERRVYLSAHTAELAGLATHLAAASDRGVDVVIVHFGPLPDGISTDHAYGHHSTEGTLYRHHQARHLAVVADSTRGLWAVAPDGKQWTSAVLETPWLVALVKGYIRHDLYFQRVYDDFEVELKDRYGPSLDVLRDYYEADGDERSPAQTQAHDDETQPVRMDPTG
jgi:sugar-specific transcriptional regulator TrmB